MTRTRTVCAPGVEKVNVGLAPWASVNDPEPMSQSIADTVPSESEDPDASNDTGWPTVGLLGENVNDADGG